MINSSKSFRCAGTVSPVGSPSRSPRTVERAGGGAGDGGAAVARLAGGNALIHVVGIEGAVAAHWAERGRARDILLLVAGSRQKRKQGDRKETHGMSNHRTSDVRGLGCMAA